ncbi:MAG: ADP-forming succinate--CoA ligase subunit beta, partial [Nitrospinae bacterium]|nr:ADP-forming succinate--CoA ligase subunit beta [Nitrospinota bacterium]
VIDRASASPVIMASEAGGMDIEEIAETSPEKIIKETIDISAGIMPYQVRRMAFALNIKKEIFKDFSLLLTNLYKTFIEMDCSIAEINPLVITDNGRVLALDAKMDFDDNAQYRHKELIDLRDFDEEEPLEVEASRHRLNYIKLDGNIGCMVNGAGLAMGTMDIIKLAGGEPANFLDVGGGANEEMVENAFKILMKDKNVKAVFINIFGGILRCDVLAKGVKQAVENIKVSVPVIVRMEGTNFEEGKEILKSADFNFIIASGMMDGAQKAVATLKTGNR